MEFYQIGNRNGDDKILRFQGRVIGLTLDEARQRSQEELDFDIVGPNPVPPGRLDWLRHNCPERVIAEVRDGKIVRLLEACDLPAAA